MIKSKQIMSPPWIAYPEIERGSIGWRMGCGEDYLMKWGRWFDALDEEEQKEYQVLFPEPVTWKGYWHKEHEENLYTHKEFWLKLWRENGIPKYSIEQIKEMFLDKKKLNYTMFWGHQPAPDGSITKSCFSQWWKSEFRSGITTYCCMEQYMMAKKAELFGDEEICQQILQCSDPKKIKALGRKVRNFDETVWDEVKYSIVLNGNYHKFTQNPELRNFLLSTKDSIIAEASPYDGIWGIKMKQSDEDSLNPLKWRGQNLLGFALMEVRDEIRRVWKNVDMCQEINENLSCSNIHCSKFGNCYNMI
ncbi:MAG: NADAR family protein [Lachnospiraceae bacterium]|nr:NADAR family protein [Lachnospiraceae bacterium]